MSNMVVNTNVLALNAHRSMKNVGTSQFRASQRLSSGLRINSAADDAAGLAISEKMRSQIRGLDQASRNAQDGISLIQTAEGAMSTVNSMVNRIRELVVQAANDTNVHDENRPELSDRQRIQDEINQLLDEIDATALRTEFNTRTLLNGELGAHRVINTMVGGQSAVFNTWQQALGGAAEPVALSALLNQLVVSGDLDLGGHANIQSWLTAGGGFGGALGANATAAGMGQLNAWSAAAGNTDWAGTLDTLVVNGGTDDVPYLMQVEANTRPTLGDLVRQSVDGMTLAQMATLYNAARGLVTGDPGFLVAPTVAVASDVTDFRDTLNAAFGAGTFESTFVAGTPLEYSVTLENNDAAVHNVIGTLLNNGMSLTAQSVLGTVGLTTAALDAWAENQPVYENTQHMDPATGRPIEEYIDFEEWAADHLIGVAGTVTTREKGGNSLWFQIGANAGQGIHLNIESVQVRDLVSADQFASIRERLVAAQGEVEGGQVRTYGERIAAFDKFMGEGRADMNTGLDFLRTMDNGDATGNVGILQVTGQDLTDMVTVLDIALAHTTEQRSRLGAVQNRLEFTIQNLDISSENLSASESRIRDADMAKEMMNFTKANVLQQAVTSMLAQANQAPMTILQLLR